MVTSTGSFSSQLKPPDTPDWVGLTTKTLPVATASRWAIVSECGGNVTFCGSVRDHSPGRVEVISLEYEVYPEHAESRLRRVAHAARECWPEIGRLALLHRVGRLRPQEVSVVVAVSTPHRAEAFAAAQFCIDMLKRTVPIWKRETWTGGTEWTLCPADAHCGYDERMQPPLGHQHE